MPVDKTTYRDLDPEVKVHIEERLAKAQKLPQAEQDEIRRSVAELLKKTPEEQLTTVRNISKKLAELVALIRGNPPLAQRTKAFLTGNLPGPEDPNDDGNDGGGTYQQ